MKEMKILSQRKRIIVESEGFYIENGMLLNSIVDSRTQLVLGHYATGERAEAIYNEMVKNFIEPNKACYYMPQE